jgi:hypothetical protein
MIVDESMSSRGIAERLIDIIIKRNVLVKHMTQKISILTGGTN